MCEAGEHLTPAATVAVAALLADMGAALAVRHGLPADDVRIGPVDLGPTRQEDQ